MADIYLVGGAVRDRLLDLPVKEKDWVVVGSNPQQLIEQGYRQVGKDFPVFLHPETKDEYALARTERKVAPGYAGFEFNTSANVSLEQDLLRRDLTINAIAEDANGNLIDPYGGVADIEQKVLRHVSPAFVEDPVRILRVARFYARFAHLGFRIAPETISLMQQMVADGEVNALVAERVWQELYKAIQEQTPAAFFNCLGQCHALPIIFPELDQHLSASLAYLKQISTAENTALYRLAALLLPFSAEQITTFAGRLAMPKQYKQLALLTHKYQAKLSDLNAESALAILSQVDAFRRPEQLHDMVTIYKALEIAPQQAEHLLQALKVTQDVDTKLFITQGFKGAALGQQINFARLEKLQLVFQN